MKNRTRLFPLITLAAATFSSSSAFAQGCVAAHANQRVMGQLITFDTGGAPGRFSIHNLTVAIGYRVFNSNKYFIGDDEIARANAIENHQNIFNIGLEYRLSPRWSLIPDVPVYNGTRHHLSPPSGIFQARGLRDCTLAR